MNKEASKISAEKRRKTKRINATINNIINKPLIEFPLASKAQEEIIETGKQVEAAERKHDDAKAFAQGVYTTLLYIKKRSELVETIK